VNCTSNAPSVAPGRHMSGITVIGVSVSCADDSLAAEVRDLLRATDVPTSGEHSMVVDTRFIGAGYGIPSPGGTAALRRFAAAAGILLDPVYTGKGAHGLLELAGEGAFPPGGDVVFLHTGGLPGLFGYPETMAPEGDPA